MGYAGISLIRVDSELFEVGLILITEGPKLICQGSDGAQGPFI